MRLGIALPDDKRLRQLCEAVLEAPARWSTLEQWSREVGASPRTVARLFRSELGTSFVQWRQQVLLSHAVTLAARKLPMATIAAELGCTLAQLSLAQPERRVPKTIDITIEYLRPARAQVSFARATLRKVGRRVANVQVECWQESRAQPVAGMTGHFLLRSPA